MILRWVGSAILEAEKKFRRVRGYREMPTLIGALRSHFEDKEVRRGENVAHGLARPLWSSFVDVRSSNVQPASRLTVPAI